MKSYDADTAKAEREQAEFRIAGQVFHPVARTIKVQKDVRAISRQQARARRVGDLYAKRMEKLLEADEPDEAEVEKLEDEIEKQNEAQEKSLFALVRLLLGGKDGPSDAQLGTLDIGQVIEISGRLSDVEDDDDVDPQKTTTTGASTPG